VHKTCGLRKVNGSEFQGVIGTETAKHFWPYLVVLERGTARSPCAAEHDHDWMIQTAVRTVHRSMLVQPDGSADNCTPGHTLCIQFSAKQAANVVDLERQW